MLIRRMLWLILVGALTLAACERKKPVTRAPAETWVSQGYDKWPQVVLTNQATFRGHTPMEGASSFLVKASDGRSFGVTARHLLGEDGGVSPEVSVARFNSVLTSWRMSPRRVPVLFVEVDKLVAHGKLKADDWLLFSLKQKGDLPARALRVRGTPVEEGETVYLLGCPYEEDDCLQNIYVGHVGGSYQGQFSFKLSPEVNLQGFSGAPVIDKDGHLVGILTGGGRSSPVAGKHLTASAQNVLAINEWLESAK